MLMVMSRGEIHWAFLAHQTEARGYELLRWAPGRRLQAFIAAL